MGLRASQKSLDLGSLQGWIGLVGRQSLTLDEAELAFEPTLRLIGLFRGFEEGIDKLWCDTKPAGEVSKMTAELKPLTPTSIEKVAVARGFKILVWLYGWFL